MDIFKKKLSQLWAILFVIAVMGIGLGLVWHGLFDQVANSLAEKFTTKDSRPEQMTYIEFEYIDPALPDKLKFKPKVSQLWIAGAGYLNLLEAPDLDSGMQAQFIINAPRGWTINLFSKSAREGFYDAKVANLSTQIFPKIKDSLLRDLCFGKEVSFFRDNKAQANEEEGGRRYSLATDSIALQLHTALGDSALEGGPGEVPVSLDLSWNQRQLRVKYRKYQTDLEFDPSRFLPGEGLQVDENRPSIIFSDQGDSAKLKQVEQDLEIKRGAFTHFYQHPSSIRLFELLESYERFGKRLGIPNLPVFLGSIFERYPASVEELVLQGKQRKPDTQLEIYRALQRCPSSLCKVMLAQNPYSFNHEIHQHFMRVVWPSMDRLEAVTYEGLGEYWSYFYATGDEAILLKIEEIANSDLRRDAKFKGFEIDPKIRREFKQSLIDHAKGHQKVARLLKSAGKPTKD